MYSFGRFSVDLFKMELSQRISKGIVGNRLQKSFGVISELLQKRRIRNLSTRK